MSERGWLTVHVILFWLIFALALVGLGQTPRMLGPGWEELLLGAVLTLISLGAIALLLRREAGSLADVGLAVDRHTLQRFGGGLVLGLAIVLAMIALLAGLTSARIETVATPDYPDAVVFSFAVLLVLAYMEEVAFRSFALVRLRQAWGVRTAIYVTAIAFAAYHGPTNPMNLLGPGVWGLIYGLAAVSSRGIALPLGIHLGANYAQSLFGMKSDYASSLWQLTPGTSGGLFPVEQVGLGMQLVLLVVGVVLIERYMRGAGDDGKHPRETR